MCSVLKNMVAYKKETVVVVSVLSTAVVVVTLASLFTTRGSLQTTSDTFIAKRLLLQRQEHYQSIKPIK
jgi:hypothetical protein